MKKIISMLWWLMLIPLSLFGWKMESGTINLPATTSGSTTWQSVALQQEYDTAPLIFAFTNEGSGYSGDTSVALRVRNITTAGFEIVQVEPQREDGPHPAMDNIHYVAIEAGSHTLPDGNTIEAGTVVTNKHQGKNSSGTKSWENKSFTSSFTSPIVIAMIQSVNNETNALPGEISVPWMVAALQNVSSSGFDTALDMVKTDSGTISSNETVAYLALEESLAGTLQDTSSCNDIVYETIKTAKDIKGWDDACYSKTFNQTYAAAPNVLGTKQTRKGGDGGWLRQCSISSSDVGVTVDEDPKGDRTHPVQEIAGLLVFSEDFVFDSTKTPSCDLQIEYRMDECYWLNNSALPGDVKDHSGNDYDASTSNSASIELKGTNPTPCNYGNFSVEPDQVSADDTTAGNTSGGFTVSFWMKADQDFEKWAVILTKSKAYDWNDGWGFVNPDSGTSTKLRFYINQWNGKNAETTVSSSDGWVHIVGSYDQNTLRLYKNGTEVDTDTDNSAITNSADPIRMAYDNGNDGEFVGSLDEVKFWDRALSSEEIDALYTNESSGKNYDGSSRTCPTCDASIAANTWELVGIPADFRNSSNPKKTVDDIFGDDMSGTFNTDWRIYKRVYNAGDNGSSYLQLALDDTLEFGTGYWLGSKLSSTWSENGAAQVDYDSTNSACTASRCVEISLVPVTNDYDDGTGPYRYNMSGFIGKMPVEWADCRFIVDGTVMTPSDLESNDIGAKQIWLYNPNDSGANSNGYTTCDDTTPGGCKLIPYKGFFIELHGPSKGKTIKLLIPQE